MTYTWVKLNPELADYRAEYGCYAHGTVCLETASGMVVVVGHCSGASRADAEKELDSISRAHPAMVGADRRISRKTFESWKEGVEA